MSQERKQDFDTANLARGDLYLIIGKRELALTDYRKAFDLGNGKACEILTIAAGE